MNTTLDSIIRGYLISQQKNTLHSYLRYMKYLIDFLRQVSLTHSFFDKTIILKLDQKKAAAVPDDFIMWNKIGWQAGDRIVAFENDGTINMHHATSADGIEAPTANPSFNNAQWPYNSTLSFNNYTTNNGECVAIPCHGIGYNGIGYFRYSHQAREIQFSSDTPSGFEIYLEHKTNGFQPKTSSTVPEIMAKLGEDYINWQKARHQFGEASVETRAREIAFMKEYDTVISRLYPITIASLTGIRARGFDIKKIVY